MTTPSPQTRRALRDYLDNQRKVGYEEGGRGRQRKIDLRRKNVPMPEEYAFVLLGERFSQPPWVIEEAPADRLAFYLGLLSLEGEFKGDLEGLGPRDDMDWGDDEG